MADLAPLHELCFFLRSHLMAGHSMLMAMEKYCRDHQNEESAELQRMIWLQRSGQKYQIPAASGPLRQLMFQTIQNGMAGQPGVEALAKLEPEIYRQSQMEIEVFVKALPIKVTLILMGLCVPSILILFFSLFLEIFIRSGGLL